MIVLEGNKIGLGGVRHVCDMLVHPSGPKHMTSLNFSGLDIEESECPFTLSLLVEILAHGSKLTTLIGKALAHPEGPKELRFLSFNGDGIQCLIESTTL